MEEGRSHSISIKTSEPKLGLGLGRQSETKSKLGVLVIGALAMLVAVPLLHLHSMLTAPLNLDTSSAQMQEQKQKNDNDNLESIKRDVALTASKNDSPKPTKTNQKTSKLRSVGAWEVMPAKDADATARVQLKPATICACAKCGSTSLWRELFAIVQGKSFDSMNYKGPPWINVLSNKKLWTNIQAEKTTDWSNFKKQDSFALIRDPKERVLSAWKSKVTCDKRSDINDHRRLVPGLLDLAGSSNITARADEEFPCLDLSDYLAVLFQIHTQGKEGFLNTHFLPQHLGCFKYAPPSMWTVVTSISDPNARCSLKSVVLRSANTSKVLDNDCLMTKSHNSTMLLNLTLEDEVILDKITSKEYEMLAQYLVA
jgi:hypothetical protein